MESSRFPLPFWKEERGNSKSDLLSFAIKEYAHRVKMEKCSELEDAYPLLEQRLAVLEEKYVSLISVLSSLQAMDRDKTLPGK